MCGRFSLATDTEELARRFGFEGDGLPRQARFNIAPGQEMLTVVGDGSRNNALYMMWGLIPSWAKDPSAGSRMINARAETIDARPAFRNAFERRRCLVPADGFYEWMKVGRRRTPVRVILRSGEPFAFAGLWETWRSPEDVVVTSCAIVTTTPNAVLQPIHNRMPVILPREAESLWLDMGRASPDELRRLLAPYPAADMEAYEVSSLVNSTGNDTPYVIERVAWSQAALPVE